jgi:hypothetical protein
MSSPQVNIKSIDLVSIDFNSKSGLVRISQKVNFVKNKYKLHPKLLNTELARRVMQPEVKAELERIIAKLLLEKFGLGSMGVFDRPPTVRVNFVRYQSDMKSKLDLYVEFSFH